MPEKQAAPQKPERVIGYYVGDSGDNFVAVSYWGKIGGFPDAIFQLNTDPAGKLYWKHLPPGGSTWDAVHQGIFRSFRYDPVQDDELPQGTPPVPPTPAGPFPSPLSEYLPPKPLGPADYPRLASALRTYREQTATVYIVLCEDTYETNFGDGEFHYLLDAFLSNEAREAFLATDHGDKTHCREMTLRLVGDVFEYPDFAHKLFDRHSVTGVLDCLEAHLRDKPAGPLQGADLAGPHGPGSTRA